MVIFTEFLFSDRFLDQFKAIDFPALKPLPQVTYVYAEWKVVRVHIDYHVEIDGHYYSVPYTFLKQQLDARMTAHMARRLKALESKYQMKAPSRLFISQRPAQFLDEKNVQWVADTIKATCHNPGLVIIDTLHRNMDGDENSSQDIGRFIANLDGFFKPLGAAVLVVHHSGHGQKDRSRGSSSIRAAMDGEFSASKNDNCVTLACHKAKDFEAFKPMLFTLKAIYIGWLDDNGENLTSVYLEHSGEIKPNRRKRNLTAIDNIILTSLSESTTEHGVEPTAEIKAEFNYFNLVSGKMQKIVNIHHWQEKAYKSMNDKTEDARRMAFSRSRAKLQDQGFIVEHENYAWRVFEC